MSKIEIESGVPMPKPKKPDGSGVLEALERMEVSQCFFLPYPEQERLAIKAFVHRLYTTIGSNGKRLARKFSIRRLHDRVGIWRTE